MPWIYTLTDGHFTSRQVRERLYRAWVTLCAGPGAVEERHRIIIWSLTSEELVSDEPVDEGLYPNTTVDLDGDGMDELLVSIPVCRGVLNGHVGLGKIQAGRLVLLYRSRYVIDENCDIARPLEVGAISMRVVPQARPGLIRVEEQQVRAPCRPDCIRPSAEAWEVTDSATTMVQIR